MTRSGPEALPDVRVALSDVREWSLGPLRCPGVIRRPFRMCGGPLGCPGVVERPSRMFGSGQEALLDVLEWLGGPP